MITININVAGADLTFLKQNQYVLCMACREMDMGYDVICFSEKDYLSYNVIAIFDEYQIFCCKNHIDRKKLMISVGPVNISMGQKITMSQEGNFSQVTGGTRKDGFEMVNDYGAIYPGFSRKIHYQGSEMFLPAFVADCASVKGTYVLRPDNRIQVWFEQFVESGVYFSDFSAKIVKAGRSRAMEVILNQDVINLSYQEGNWIK